MKWFRKKPTEPQRTVADDIADIIHGAISNLRREPINVRHTIDRKIPRPTLATFVIKDPEGRTYYLPSVNLSYKTSFPIPFPVEWITNDRRDVGKQAHIEIQLEYDPKDRSLC